jgi:hypothetical protein
MDSTITTREAYLALFASTAAAVEFENQALSIGREFLPASARRVLDGADPTPEYWSWLASQLEVSE